MKGRVPNLTRSFSDIASPAVFTIVALLAPLPALAQAESVAIEVTATVPPRCGFTAAGAVTLSAAGDLELPGQMSANVQLDCNTPFALGVASSNGAMVNVSASDDGSGFAFRKPYSVSVALDTDRGLRSSERCAAQDLKAGGACAFASTIAGAGLSSGPGISIGKRATVLIEWPAQAALPARLAAGRYEDTIILIVGARA